MKRGVISFCFIVSLFLIFLIPSTSAGFFSKLTGKTISSDDLIRGDINKDGLINLDDVSALTDHLYVYETEPDPLWIGDLNRDGQLSMGDIALLSVLATHKRGDVNADETLDEKDLTFLNNYLSTKTNAPNPLDLGDINYNDVVDAVDYSLLEDVVNEQTQTCEDSDEGIDYYTKGEVVISSGNGASMIEDKCTTGSEIANLMEYYCSESKELVSHPYLCPEGCKDGACVKKIDLDSCVDSDNGIDIYTRGAVKGGILCLSNGTCGNFLGIGEDYCLPVTAPVGEQDYVHEFFCDNNYVISKDYTCPKGCIDGACTPVVDNSVCSDFIEDIMGGSNFVIDGITYYSSYSDTGEEKLYINGIEESAIRYYSYYYSYFYDYYRSVNYRVLVFDNENIVLDGFLKSYVGSPACTILNVQDVEPESRVYVCNYDLLWQDDGLYGVDEQRRALIWYKDNVLVELDTYSGKSLTNEEIMMMAQQKLYDFIDKLKDNSQSYSSSWSNFKLDHSSELLLKKAIDSCNSEIPLDTCSPCWECKTEPLICPAHGYRTRTCSDYCCGETNVNTQQISCTPGICDGCLVPKWFGSKWGSNKCIPYGFRFEQQTDDFIEIIHQGKDSERLEEQDYPGEMSLVVESSEKAILTFYDKEGNAYEFILTPGAEVDLEVPGEFDEYLDFILVVDGIYYDTEGDSYVDITVKYSYMGKEYLKMDAYCDIDGLIHQQKTPSVDGSWATCQNNYECASNLCSSGECIEVTKMLKEAGAFKKAAVKFACRVFNPFSDEEYNNCIVNFLGLNTTPSEGGGGGSGGGSSSSSSSSSSSGGGS